MCSASTTLVFFGISRETPPAIKERRRPSPSAKRSGHELRPPPGQDTPVPVRGPVGIRAVGTLSPGAGSTCPNPRARHVKAQGPALAPVGPPREG